MGHGGGATYGVAAPGVQAAAPGLPPRPLVPRDLQGFSYFRGPPAPCQRSTLGDDPQEARQVLQALYDLLPVPEFPCGRPIENNRIPAGYTYLLQLVAHDLVETTVPFWVAVDAGIPTRNMRRTTLQLDTLYGGGPTACPMAFKPAGGQPDFRTQLRLGRVSDARALGLTTGPCPFRDLPRLKLTSTARTDSAAGVSQQGNAPLPPSNFDDFSQPVSPPPPPGEFDDAAQLYVADIRNDDSTVLTQLTVLFSILHNAIAARLPKLSAQAQFAHARVAMLHMYYAIIRNDLLLLMLHDKVYQVLEKRPASSSAWLWHGGSVPLEFTHGAFRVGHAMVRPFYQVNELNQFNIYDMVGGPVFGDSAREPLPSNWILEWSRFFELPGGPLNYSLKLAVQRQRSLDFPGVLPAVADNTPATLSLRDWLSAAAARMWRPDALIDEARPRYGGVTFIDRMQIETWLRDLVQSPTANATAKAIVEPKIPALATDLPLPLYVLLESELDAKINGERMGALGSIIVGEVLFRRLAENEAKLARFRPAAEQAFGDDAWRRIDDVKSMPALIQLAEDWGGLANCRQIPFTTASEF
jgi:hypothetical protein